MTNFANVFYLFQCNLLLTQPGGLTKTVHETSVLMVLDIFQLHLTLRFTLHYDLSVNGDLLWTLFKRCDVSSNWNLSFSSATKYYIFYPEIFFYLNKQCIP